MKWNITVSVQADAIDEAMDTVSTALAGTKGVEITNISEDYEAANERDEKLKAAVNKKLGVKTKKKDKLKPYMSVKGR